MIFQRMLFEDYTTCSSISAQTTLVKKVFRHSERGSRQTHQRRRKEKRRVSAGDEIFRGWKHIKTSIESHTFLFAGLFFLDDALRSSTTPSSEVSLSLSEAALAFPGLKKRTGYKIDHIWLHGQLCCGKAIVKTPHYLSGAY